MSKKNKWFMELYLILFSVAAIKSASAFFSSNSEIHFYYFFLCSFDKIFFIPYTLNMLQVIFNVLFCIMLSFYIFNISLIKSSYWKWFFALKIIFDLTGHAYDSQLIFSLRHYDIGIAALILLQGIFFNLPGYVAGYCFAFNNNASVK